MSIGIIILAIIAAFLAFRFVTGIIKFVLLGLILLAAVYFFSGGFAG